MDRRKFFKSLMALPFIPLMEFGKDKPQGIVNWYGSPPGLSLSGQYSKEKPYVRVDVKNLSKNDIIHFAPTLVNENEYTCQFSCGHHGWVQYPGNYEYRSISLDKKHTIVATCSGSFDSRCPDCRWERYI